MGLKSVEKFPEHSEDKAVKQKDIETEISNHAYKKNDIDTKIDTIDTDIKKTQTNIGSANNKIMQLNNLIVNKK